MQQSPDMQKFPHLFADMREAETEDDQHQSQEQDDDTGGQPPQKLYVYRTDTGGWLATPTKIEGDEDTPVEDEEPEAPIVESNAPTPETDERATPTTSRREPPYLLHVLLLLFVFLLLDSEQGVVTALFMPTAVIAITPNMRTISLQSSLPLGKLLEPLTLSESQTVAATGHGHQNAQAAEGTLTFYNGLFTPQYVAQGMVFTGNDGVQVITDQSVTIPANVPPVDGEATVPAHALYKGAKGNISAGDVDTIINNGLLVKNNQFSGGQDERDYKVVTQADTNTAAAALKRKVTASMSAALQQQLTPTEQLQTVPCTPTVTADHTVGQEAENVTVTVSMICTAIAYDTNILQVKATELLTTQAVKTVGKGYMVYGNISVTLTKSTTTQKNVVLSFTAYGTWVYHINESAVQALVSGKPRLKALQLLTHLPGVKRASISGVDDNQPLPTDTSHLHVLVYLLVS